MAGKQQETKELTEEQKQQIRELSQMSLWLDDYNDLFSDFDPRPYSKRALSDDFLTEAKRVAKETSQGKIELKLLVPAMKRNTRTENIIKKHMKEHFRKQHTHLQEKRKGILKEGVLFIISGVILMLVTTFILYKHEEVHFFLTFLSIIAEPGGWFLFWEGLNLIIFQAKERNSDMVFNHKMANSAIEFLSY